MYVPGLMAATGGRLRLDAVDVVTDCVSVQTVSQKGVFNIRYGFVN